MFRLLMIAMAATACTASSSSGISASDVVCPTGSSLTYENFGSAFLSDNCLSCHASKERPALTTQAAVQANRSAMISAAVTSTRMPAQGELSVEERQMLGEWLACGAP